MLQPQSDEDIRPVVEALRRLDALVDLRWNPQARMVKPGDYTVLGKRTDPEYSGLWEVIRYDTPGLHDRPYVVLCQVTQPTRYGRRQILMMESGGPYAPVGEWLVEYMQTWDAAQKHFAGVMEAMNTENERVEADVDADVANKAAHQEAAERVYHDAAGPYWMGGAQGKASPETAKLLFGKGKRTSSTVGASSL